LRVHVRISHECLKADAGGDIKSGEKVWGWNLRQSLRRICRSIYVDWLLYTQASTIDTIWIWDAESSGTDWQ
jgi:hypothetical protein